MTVPVAERLFNLDTYCHGRNIFTSLFLTSIVGLEEIEYCQVRSSNRLCCGRESGFVILSKIGFTRYRDEIKNKFIFLQNNPSGRGSPQGTWESYEQDAMKLYSEIITESKKHVNSLHKKANELQDKIQQQESSVETKP